MDPMPFGDVLGLVDLFHEVPGDAQVTGRR